MEKKQKNVIGAQEEGKEWSGDACYSGCIGHAQPETLDLILGPQNLIEGFFMIKS